MSNIPLFDFDIGRGSEPKQLIDVRGGSLAPQYRHRSGKVLCDLLELDSPVAAGETAVIEFTEVYPPDYPDVRFIDHTVSRPARQTLIWVRFDPSGVPDWCEEFTKTGGTGSTRLREVVGTDVHAVRFGFGPATLGLRWGFDGTPDIHP